MSIFNKPSRLEIIKWNGNNIEQIKEFCSKNNSNCFCEELYDDFGVWIRTENKSLYRAMIGDYIIREENGECYPCSEHDLQKKYVKDEEGFVNKKEPKGINPKTLSNTNVEEAINNVKDLNLFGDGDTFKLISKASSKSEGWMKSTKAMQIDGLGCVLQVSTQQKNPDGSYVISESLSYIPNTKIEEQKNELGIVVGRKLIII